MAVKKSDPIFPHPYGIPSKTEKRKPDEEEDIRPDEPPKKKRTAKGPKPPSETKEGSKAPRRSARVTKDGSSTLPQEDSMNDVQQTGPAMSTLKSQMIPQGPVVHIQPGGFTPWESIAASLMSITGPKSTPTRPLPGSISHFSGPVLLNKTLVNSDTALGGIGDDDEGYESDVDMINSQPKHDSKGKFQSWDDGDDLSTLRRRGSSYKRPQQ